MSREPAIDTVMDGRRVVLDELTAALPGGRTGYYQRSQTDCLQAAAATCLQVPYEDLEGIRHYLDLYIFAAQREMSIRFHRHDELPPTPDLWIALTPKFAGYNGARHTVVGEGEREFFDPASGWRFEDGTRPPGADEIDIGISFHEGFGPTALEQMIQGEVL
jgi:hypothetical protein